MHTGTDQVQNGRKFVEFQGIPINTKSSVNCYGYIKDAQRPVSEDDNNFEGHFQPC